MPQHGWQGLPFTCCPTAFHSRLDAQVFRVLLLPRLWFPFFPPRSCRCDRVLGHHQQRACIWTVQLPVSAEKLSVASLSTWCPRQSRRAPVGGRCGRAAIVPRGPDRTRHDSRFCFAQGWNASSSMCERGWSRTGSGPTAKNSGTLNWEGSTAVGSWWFWPAKCEECRQFLSAGLS